MKIFIFLKRPYRPGLHHHHPQQQRRHLERAGEGAGVQSLEGVRQPPRRGDPTWGKVFQGFSRRKVFGMSNKVEILKFLKASPKSRIIFANYRRVIEGRRSWKDWGYQRCQLNKKHEWWQKPPAKASRALPDASGGSRLNIGELFWAILGVRKSFFTTRSR